MFDARGWQKCMPAFALSNPNHIENVLSPLRRGKPKLVLYAAKRCLPATPGAGVNDFSIYASYRPSAGGAAFYGTLKVVRLTDGRLLFPFEGAPTIGPFNSKEEATEAAQVLGASVVDGDVAHPET
jgi:hypothetical protein